MSEFILAFATDSARYVDEVISEMRRRFPDETFLEDTRLGKSHELVIPIQGTAGSLEDPGYMRPVNESLLSQIRTEFAMVLEAAKARPLQ